MEIQPAPPPPPPPRRLPKATAPSTVQRSALEAYFDQASDEEDDRRKGSQYARPKVGFPERTSATNALLITASALAYQCENEIREALKQAPCGPYGAVEIFHMREAPAPDHRAGTAADPRRAFLRAFGFVDDNNAYLAFKGTQAGRDWLLNLQSWMIERPARHAGFHQAWRAIRDDVETWLKWPEVAGKTLHVGGHSLGGAMAVLASYELAGTGIPIGNIVTVGQPRVGGRSFNAAFTGTDVRNADGQALCSRYESYVHGADPVPWKPPFWLGFSHVKSLRRIDVRSLFALGHDGGTPTPSGTIDHRLPLKLVCLLLSASTSTYSIAAGLLQHSDALSDAALDAVKKHASIGYARIMAPGQLLSPAAINAEGANLQDFDLALCARVFVTALAIAGIGWYFSTNLLTFILNVLGIILLLVSPILIWNWIRG